PGGRRSRKLPPRCGVPGPVSVAPAPPSHYQCSLASLARPHTHPPESLQHTPRLTYTPSATCWGRSPLLTEVSAQCHPCQKFDKCFLVTVFSEDYYIHSCKDADGARRATGVSLQVNIMPCAHLPHCRIINIKA
ncbi:hypothetical protein OTU49_004452, partial [Cherax quadricarinatus]